MNVILIMLGIILGVGLLTAIGCYLYWYEEDKKLDREAEHMSKTFEHRDGAPMRLVEHWRIFYFGMASLRLI